MIAFLKGLLAEKGPARAVIDVSGVGFELAISLSTYEELPRPGEEVKLITLTYLREDTIRLYGFAGKGEADLFRQLLAVQGIGPKLALGILSGIRPADFRNAVLAEDVGTLSRIPGIGKKSANRMILELKGRFEKEGSGAVVTGRTAGEGEGMVEEALLALETLGIRSDQASRAVDRVLKRGDGRVLTAGELVREVLSGV